MRAIHPKDMATGLSEQMFWYVSDESTNQLIAVPNDQANESVVILFNEKSNAETWKYVVSKSPAHQDHLLRVEGDKFQAIFENSLEHQQFKIFPVSSEEAGKFFEAYNDILRMRGFEKNK